MAVIQTDNPVVQAYIVYSAILVLKVLVLSILTGRKRVRKQVFSNAEDVPLTSKGKIKFDDPDVERIRRAHLNDLENIPAFWILGALFVTTNPDLIWATLLFRAFTAGRVIHTIVYAIKPLPPPSRGIAFFIPYVVLWYMGIQVVLHYITAL